MMNEEKLFRDGQRTRDIASRVISNFGIQTEEIETSEEEEY